MCGEDCYSYKQNYLYPFDSCVENIKEDGCYYLPVEICKDIVINAEASGEHRPKAIKKLRSKINLNEIVIEAAIPALGKINHDIISYYSGELAESLIDAVDNGKGVEIAIGYPRVLVINVV